MVTLCDDGETAHFGKCGVLLNPSLQLGHQKQDISQMRAYAHSRQISSKPRLISSSSVASVRAFVISVAPGAPSRSNGFVKALALPTFGTLSRARRFRSLNCITFFLIMETSRFQVQTNLRAQTRYTNN